MKKKFLLVNLLFILLFSTAHVSASTFIDPILFSENTVSGWNLLAGTSFSANPATEPTVKIDSYEATLTYSPDANYYKGLIGGGHPSAYRGKKVFWKSGLESMTSSIRSGPHPDTGSYSLEIIDLSDDLMVTSGGTHLSWTNMYKDLTRFQIRIWEDTNPIWVLDHKYFHTETMTGDYEIDLSGIGFSFKDGSEYFIRLEARKNDVQIDPIGDFTGWAGIINRSNTDINYTHNSPVPEPATLFLFGFGILGLAQISRKNSI